MSELPGCSSYHSGTLNNFEMLVRGSREPSETGLDTAKYTMHRLNVCLNAAKVNRHMIR